MSWWAQESCGGGWTQATVGGYINIRPTFLLGGRKGRPIMSIDLEPDREGTHVQIWLSAWISNFGGDGAHALIARYLAAQQDHQDPQLSVGPPHHTVIGHSYTPRPPRTRLDMDSTVVYLVHLACCTSCAPLSPPASCPLWEAAAVRAVGEYHRHVSKKGGAAIQHFRADTDKNIGGGRTGAPQVGRPTL